MIEFHSVCRRYGQLTAVDQVDVRIGQGEIVGLLGHNGAGKTTLMKMLTGYLEPSSGHVTVGGHDLLTDRTAAQRLLGYLPEAAPAYGDMLVQDYLITMAQLRGVPADQVGAAVARAVQRTGLQQRLMQRIDTLSKGYKQRVGLAQAIVHEPKVLVLDEPTNGLDPAQIVQIRALIKELAEHSTVLLSTHILQEVEAMCDRVLVMIDGRLVADRSLADLLASQELLLQLADGATLEGLVQLPGILSVDPAPELDKPGLSAFLVRYDGDPPTEAVLAHALQHGWPVRGLAPHVHTLEHVVGRLTADHVAHREVVVGGAA